MENETYLKLVQKPTIFHDFIKKSFKFYLKVHDLKTTEVDLKFDENNENFHSFRVQSYSYEENGEKIYRNIECKEKLIDSMEGVNTLCDLMQQAILRNKDSKFLGVRPILEEKDFHECQAKSMKRYHFGEYEWISYLTAKVRIDNLSLLYLKKGCNFEKKMALFSETSPFWFMSAHALFQINSPVVTLYATLSNDNILHALNFTKVTGILVDKRTGPRIIPLMSQIPSLKTIYCLKCQLDITEANLTQGHSVDVVVLDDMDFDKKIMPLDKDKIQNLAPSPKDLAFIMFTSGSTGNPKGVMLTHENIVSAVSVTYNEHDFWKKRRYLAYLPQAHILEFIAETVILLHDGELGFGHPFSLSDASPMIIPGTKGDLTALQPTFFSAVPIFLERIMKACFDKIRKLPMHKKIVFQEAYNAKLRLLKNGVESPRALETVFGEFRKLLGGKASHAYIGGACLNKNTEDFINVCFGTFKQAYGLTETSCAGALSNFNYWRTGNVGPVAKCVELKFIPWEEGGYSPDDSQGPRGEILLSGKCISTGYYNMPEITNEAFITDEKTGKTWFKTGDIGTILKDGTIRIIDRKKDIVKLKHGEYVSLVQIEQSIIQNILVDMVCVLPNVNSDYLVALIVPNREETKNLCIASKKKHETMDAEELIRNQLVQELIQLDIIIKLEESGKLNKYELPHKICIVSDIWTPESGLITPSAKIRRPIIASKYKNFLS